MQLSRKTVVIAACAGVAAFVLHSAYLRGEEERLLAQLGERGAVVVAKSDIREGVPIEAEWLELRSVPAKFAQPGALKHVEDAVMQVATAPIRAGEQIVVTKLAGGVNTGVAVYVDPALRGYSIAVDDVTSMTALLEPQNRVDVFGTFVVKNGNEDETTTKVLLQNVRVLAVGRTHQGSRPISVTRLENDVAVVHEDRREPSIESVTLEVSLADAAKLALAQEIGNLSLALRSAVDDGKVLGPEGGNRPVYDKDLVDKPIKTVPRGPIIQGGRS